MTLTFRVVGLPKPAGSKRAFPIRRGGVFTGRVAVVDDCAGSRDWKATVAHAAAGAIPDAARDQFPATGPLRLEVCFAMPRPKRHFRTGRNAHLLAPCAPAWPEVKPDVTKLLRAVEDALTGILWRDDAQIVCQHASKIYASVVPGAVITVSSMEAASTAE